MRKSLAPLATAGWIALSVGAGLAHGQSPRKASPPSAPARPQATSGQLSAQDAALFEERFTREVWPLLERSNGGCVSCHSPGSASQLHFAGGGGAANFKRLLTQSFFEPDNPSGLLSRVASPLNEQRMPPPPSKRWSDDETTVLRAFVNDLYDKVHKSDVRPDELFPVELLDPYTGKRLARGPDNTFLTYRQLRGKIKTIFGDEWRRDERDLFQENIAQFGGADFIKRFDESSKASAPFLSALDALSRDTASRAYLASSGPFRGRAETLPAPLKMAAPDAAYRAEITRLYRRLLYRNPSDAETQQAFGFLKSIYASEAAVAREESALDFELEVADAAGRSTTRAFRVRMSSEPLGLYQEFVDQGRVASASQVRESLDRPLTFKPRARGQRVELSNEATNGNVSLAAVELKGPLPATTVKRIDASGSGVNLQGAWQRVERDGFVSYEDGNDNKGSSRIEVPIDVPAEGRYEVTVVWRKPGAAPGRGRNAPLAVNAGAVLVEVYSQDAPSLANPPLPPVPPRGEAHFTVDQTLDTIPHWDLKTAFRFGAAPEEGVEVHNRGTQRRVVADAVKFVPVAAGGKEFLLDDPEAEGGWPQYELPRFRPYNLVGRTAVTDNNQKKGEMRLAYRPAKAPGWRADTLYRVMIGFPGKADNETRAPIVVRAQESTPVVQLSVPLHVSAGAPVTLDASTTYNIQRSPLKFAWRQLGGPRVKLSDPAAPTVTFRAAPMSAQQAAWEGLCRALMKHPDFLFTRPRSLAFVKDPTDRRRLHLVKVAQDLVGRPPTESEVRQLEGGTPLPKLVDQYLAGPEFRDFYFHRIRLVLETRGSEVDDEPVRLWSYVAFNNRPFKELLTADYSVDANLQRQPRPAYHGKTGLLTMKGFIQGKPGLPHFNYAALVTEKFLGYVYEVPPSIVQMRDSITAASTTSPTSVCYSCHKILTPLAYQRLAWDDEGNFKPMDGKSPVDDTDRALVPSYPYRGKGMEAFAVQAVNKERFVRTIFQTHFVMYFGREMRYQEDERGLYKRLWDNAHASNFSIKSLLRTLVTSPEYLLAGSAPAAPKAATPRRAVRR